MPKNWTFTRMFDAASINGLQQEALFVNHLKADCLKGEVFPAIRNNRIDFYHKGGKLFSWDKTNGFYTHQKYASVLYGKTSPYVKQSAFSGKNLRLIADFCQGYDRIKENCAEYSKEEAAGVANLYHKFSCAANYQSPREVRVLDIEISFAGDAFNKQSAARTQTEDSDCEDNHPETHDGKTPSDRIDFVAIDKNGVLRFFEAKHYSNRASLRRESGIPLLCEQLARYDAYLKKHAAGILAAYQTHVRIINALFGVSIPLPVGIDNAPDHDPKTRALIFGFDSEQKQYLDKHILPALDKNGDPLENRTYAKGDIANANLATIFHGGRQNWAIPGAGQNTPILFSPLATVKPINTSFSPLTTVGNTASGVNQSAQLRGSELCALRGNASGRLAYRSKIQRSWKTICNRILNSLNSSSSGELRPSRRIPSAFDLIDDSKISRIAVVADLSSAISAQILYSYLADLASFSRAADFDGMKPYFCFFYKDENDGQRYEITRIKKNFSGIEDAFVNGNALTGATSLPSTLELMKTSIRTDPDALLIFTSGKISETIGDNLKRYLTTMRRRTVWILPHDVQEVDDAFRQATSYTGADKMIVGI